MVSRSGVAGGSGVSFGQPRRAMRSNLPASAALGSVAERSALGPTTCLDVSESAEAAVLRFRDARDEAAPGSVTVRSSHAARILNSRDTRLAMYASTSIWARIGSAPKSFDLAYSMSASISDSTHDGRSAPGIERHSGADHSVTIAFRAESVGAQYPDVIETYRYRRGLAQHPR